MSDKESALIEPRSVFPQPADTSNPVPWKLGEASLPEAAKQWAAEGMRKIATARFKLRAEWAERIKAARGDEDEDYYRHICDLAADSLFDFDRSHRLMEQDYMETIRIASMFDPPPFLIIPKS